MLDSEERIILGPLLPPPEQEQRQRRALGISATVQVVLVAILALWPPPAVIPFRTSPDTTVVRLDWPVITFPVARPKPIARLRLPAPPRVRPHPIAPMLPPPPVMHRLMPDPPAQLSLTRPRPVREPGPMRVPVAVPVVNLDPAPRFAVAEVGAAPIELNRFAAAASVAHQAAEGAVRSSGFGGPRTTPIAPAALAPAAMSVNAAGLGARPGTSSAPAGDGVGVRTAGFGTAVTMTSGGSGPMNLASAGFDAPQPPPAARTSSPPAPAVDQPVEILFKPIPVYSAEGRQLGIQGDVVLAVQFQANGHLYVKRIVHGLGHGLDQAAISAAEGIRFRPAQHNGAAIEVAALIRVTFQLAQ